MTNAMTTFRPHLPHVRPGMLGRNVFDDVFDSFFNQDTVSSLLRKSTTGYPVADIYQGEGGSTVMEFALAGFKKDEVKVYTEYGKLNVEGQKEEKDDKTYAHQGLAQRSFSRSWAISDDTEVRDVNFEDGLLTVVVGKIVPEHHARKDWL